MNPAAFLVVVSLGMLAIRFHQPWAKPLSGAVIRVWSVPLSARIRLQRTNVYAIAAVLVLGGAGGWLPGGAQILVVVAVIALLALPVHYTLADDGIVLGRTTRRLWTEFSTTEERPGRIELQGKDGHAPLTVWLPGPPDDRAAISDVRRLAGRLPAAPGNEAAGIATTRSMRVRRGKGSSARAL